MAEEKFVVDTLRQLLGVQGELCDLAEGRWKRAQRALVSMLETYDPEEVDRRLKKAEPLDNLDVEDLVRLIVQGINNRLYQKRVQQNVSAIQASKEKGSNNPVEIGKLQTENHRLVEENRTLREERDGFQSLLAAFQRPPETKLKKMTIHPEGQNVPEPSQVEEAPEPDWMLAWRKTETFEREADTLRILGETGLARLPLIELRMGNGEAGGNPKALLDHLEALGLIEFFLPWGPGKGIVSPSPVLPRLAERGRLAYMLLSGAAPVQNEYDALLARNIHPEHILLYLKTADMLHAVHHQVNLSPTDIPLPDGSQFKPDLQAIDSKGQTLYISVEPEAGQSHAERQTKWRKALQAGSGQIYLICEDLACMRSIRSAINFGLGRQAGQCSLTNLADLQAGKRAEDGGIWLDVRSNQAAS